jgi:hypothetical protein
MSADGVDCGPYYPLPLEHSDIVVFLLYATALAHPTVMFRREIVLKVGNYRDLIPEDYDLWLRMAVNFRLANLEEDLVRYRTHDRSFTQVIVGKERAEAVAVGCVCENALQLYGRSEAEIRPLRERRHRCAILALLGIAWYLKRTQGISFLGNITSQSFANALDALRSPSDMASRLWQLGRRYCSKCISAPRSA